MRKNLLWIALCFLSLSACSDLGTTEGDERSVDKTFGSYYEDPYNDTYHVSDPDAYGDQTAGWYSEDEEALIDEFLNTWLGDPQEGDLTDGSTLVAGPALSPDVVLSCNQGVISVTQGIAVGALATTLAASGVSFAGVGVGATIPASLPLYATAGGMIAFGLSGEAWSNCLFGLARLGFALMQEGYWSAARGVQNIVRSNRAQGGAFARPSAPSTSTSTTATAECRPHGEKCEAIKHRYKDVFCAGVEETRNFLGINVHDNGVCDLGGLGCADLDELMRLASGCWIGRQAMTDRCYDGNEDEGHRRATEYAQRDFNSCARKYRELACGDVDARRNAHQQSAQESYPECR